MLNPITIHTVKAEQTSGFVLVQYNWRTTAQKVVPDSQKHRSCLVPVENLVTQEVKEIPAKFRAIVLKALEEIASERLADFCQSSNMMAATISADLFNVDALLAWNNERQQLQQRLTADEVKAWAPTSATVAAVTAKHGADHGKAMVAQLVKLAGPNHGLTPEKAGKILDNLWATSDADNLTGLRVMLRLQAIREATTADDMLDSILG
jgi:hypothetical protein